MNIVNNPPPAIVEVTFIRPVMNRKEAAEYLRVSCKTIDTWIAEGKLKCSRIGHSVRVRREWLDEYMDDNCDSRDAKETARRMLEQMK
jgi:excisionase family DNA binding protein